MTDQQPTLPPRICRFGHRVSQEGRSGVVRYGSYSHKPYLACRACQEQYRADVGRLGLKQR